MTTEGISLAATIIMVFPMMYFAIVTPNFFFFKFSDLTVTWVLRGLFNTYFLTMSVCSAIGMIAFVLAGRPVIALGVGLICALAVAARRWFLREIDAQLRARDAGDIDALRQLRRLHVGGMLYNVVQLASVAGSIPFVFAAA